MPTAARLFATLVLIATTWMASRVFVADALPEGSDPTWFLPVNAAWALIVGWRVVGAGAGGGMAAALANGLRGAVVLLFAVVLTHAIWEMLLRSMALRYDGPVEAVTAVFVIALNFLAQLAEAPRAGVILLLGAFLAGILAELAGRLWR